MSFIWEEIIEEIKNCLNFKNFDKEKENFFTKLGVELDELKYSLNQAENIDRCNVQIGLEKREASVQTEESKSEEDIFDIREIRSREIEKEFRDAEAQVAIQSTEKATSTLPEPLCKRCVTRNNVVMENVRVQVYDEEMEQNVKKLMYHNQFLTDKIQELEDDTKSEQVLIAQLQNENSVLKQEKEKFQKKQIELQQTLQIMDKKFSQEQKVYTQQLQIQLSELQETQTKEKYSFNKEIEFLKEKNEKMSLALEQKLQSLKTQNKQLEETSVEYRIQIQQLQTEIKTLKISIPTSSEKKPKLLDKLETEYKRIEEQLKEQEKMYKCKADELEKQKQHEIEKASKSFFEKIKSSKLSLKRIKK